MYITSVVVLVTGGSTRDDKRVYVSTHTKVYHKPPGVSRASAPVKVSFSVSGAKVLFVVLLCTCTHRRVWFLTFPRP